MSSKKLREKKTTVKPFFSGIKTKPQPKQSSNPLQQIILKAVATDLNAVKNLFLENALPQLDEDSIYSAIYSFIPKLLIERNLAESDYFRKKGTQEKAIIYEEALLLVIFCTIKSKGTKLLVDSGKLASISEPKLYIPPANYNIATSILFEDLLGEASLPEKKHIFYHLAKCGVIPSKNADEDSFAMPAGKLLDARIIKEINVGYNDYLDRMLSLFNTNIMEIIKIGKTGLDTVELKWKQREDEWVEALPDFPRALIQTIHEYEMEKKVRSAEVKAGTDKQYYKIANLAIRLGFKLKLQENNIPLVYKKQCTPETRDEPTDTVTDAKHLEGTGPA